MPSNHCKGNRFFELSDMGFRFFGDLNPIILILKRIIQHFPTGLRKVLGFFFYLLLKVLQIRETMVKGVKRFFFLEVITYQFRKITGVIKGKTFNIHRPHQNTRKDKTIAFWSS